MDELKACPFCGSSNTTLDYYEISCPQELGTIVVCNDCGASAKSIVDWNTRPIEDALNARIAELEAERRWIPVSERLPDIEDGDSKDYDVVLTYPFRRDVIVATWSYDALDKTHRRRWFDCWSDEWGPDDITDYVTHWRERPTPPEVER